MPSGRKKFELRYVGARFNGARLPLDVLADLPAFRDLLISYAKDIWRLQNTDRKRLPKGFDKSLSFDLVEIADGSAVPVLDWNRQTAQANLPGFADELEEIVEESYQQVVRLIDSAGDGKFPSSLSSEHIRALNKLGSGLQDGERMEFRDSHGSDGNVVYLDARRRRALITHVTDRYQARFESVGRLLGSHIDGHIDVVSSEHGEFRIPVDSERVVKEFDGNINSEVQFSLQIELDHNDHLRSVVDVFDVDIIDADSAEHLMRCRNRLADLRGLGAGWHDGVGNAITTAAAETAESFLGKRPHLASAFKIYPTDEGGLLFEFEWRGWDFSVEFSSDGRVEMYGVKLDGPDEMEPQEFDGTTEDFLRVFDERVGH